MVKVIIEADSLYIEQYTLPTGEVFKRSKYGNLYYSALKPYIGEMMEHHVIGEGIDYKECAILRKIHTNDDGQSMLLWDFIDSI